MHMLMAQGLADRKIQDVISSANARVLRAGAPRRQSNRHIDEVRSAVGSALIAAGGWIRGTRTDLAARPAASCRG